MTKYKKCEVCDRPLIPEYCDEHHLIPKTFKGKRNDDNMVLLHKICHQKIHSVFSERELVSYYHTMDRIMENEDMQKFGKWVGKQPIEFSDVSKDTKRRKSKRRR